MSRKKAAFVVTSLALVSLILLLACWKDLLVSYHLYRLRSDEGYLKALLEVESFRDAESLAVASFTKTAEGKERVFEFYLSLFETEIELWRAKAIPAPEFGAVGVVNESYYFVGLNGLGLAAHSLETTTPNAPLTTRENKTLKRLSPFLQNLKEEEFSSSKYPSIRFQFVSSERAARSTGYYTLPAPEGHPRPGTPWKLEEVADPSKRPPPWVGEQDLQVLSQGMALVFTAN